MPNEHDFPADDVERAWLDALPRTAESPPDAEERLMTALQRQQRHRHRWPVAPLTIGLAAAVLLFVAGVQVGRTSARRESMDWQLARTDLSRTEQLLLLQRAGTYYALAMQRVATAAPDDSTTAEVARQSLTAAALAATHAHLDGDFAPTLVSLLEPAPTGAATPSDHLIWY